MKKNIYVITAFLFYPGIYGHAVASDADTTFRQPVSVKYHFSSDLRGSVSKKVVVDYNDVVYVLTDKGLCRVNENEVVKDLLYRPLAEKVPVDIVTQETSGYLYYLYDSCFLTNAYAGMPHGALPKGKYNKIAVAADGRALALGWSRTVILMRDIPDTLKELARTLLTNNDEDRKSVIQKFEATLSLEGDPVKGKVVFQSNCIVCHQVRGQMGLAFGPDLGTVHNWTAEGIMISILDPNLSISHGYDMWDVTLNNGTSSHGIITAETPNAIILNSEGGVKTTIARQNIKSLKTMGVSAMPVGFEKKIDKQQMADLHILDL